MEREHDVITLRDMEELSAIEALEDRIAPDGGETVLPL